VIDADAFAALLCKWCLEVDEGQQVLVTTTTLAVPLVEAVHRAILERSAWPLLRLETPAQTKQFFDHAKQLHLEGFAPLELTDARDADSSLRIDAGERARVGGRVDPELIARTARARMPLREARLAHRWCRTLWPTPALAEQAAMEPEAYAQFVARALFLDQPDPVGAWKKLSERQQALVERLSAAREIRVEAEQTDLRLNVEGRTWINSDGRRNMPSGEVFTGPHEHSANGTILFTLPTSPSGVEVEDVRLTFVDGEVVASSAARGEDYLRAALATDEGARYVGEVGIGTNVGIDRPTGSILLDEKMAGTVHLALGRSYPETEGTNTSALHWDLICDLRHTGRLSADGDTLPLVE
jgi:aminopeptidase